MKIYTSGDPKETSCAHGAYWRFWSEDGKPLDFAASPNVNTFEQARNLVNKFYPNAEVIQGKPVVSTEDALAKEFCAVLRSWLTTREMATVVKRNRKLSNDLICHSHDFCDANMAMAEAFHNLNLLTCFDVSEDGEETPAYKEANRLWNAAWDIAKAAEFSL